MSKKKEIEEVLFPEITIELKSIKKSIIVKPWTFGELVRVNPDIEEIFQQLEGRGTSIDLDNLGFGTMKNIYFASMSKIGDIILKTVPVLSKEELEGLAVDEVITIAMAIFHSNRESLKNVFRPFWFNEVMSEPTGASQENPKE